MGRRPTGKTRVISAAPAAEIASVVAPFEGSPGMVHAPALPEAPTAEIAPSVSVIPPASPVAPQPEPVPAVAAVPAVLPIVDPASPAGLAVARIMVPAGAPGTYVEVDATALPVPQPVPTETPLPPGSDLGQAPVKHRYVHPVDREPAPGAVRVLCSAPGLELVGHVHPAKRDYPPGTFDYRQLAAMMAHPKLSVIALHGEAVVRPSVTPIVRLGGTP